MKILINTPSGQIQRDLTIAELKAYAKDGNTEAIRELISLKGGYETLTTAQKEKVNKLLLGYDVDL